MIPRPDYIRRKYVLVGAAIALGITAVIVLGDGAAARRPRAAFAASHAGDDAAFRTAPDGVPYDPWRPYDAAPSSGRRLAP